VEITVTIPDELAGQILLEDLDPARQALEDMAVEAYRAHRLSGSQLRRLLGIPSRYELDAFLKKRGVWLEYTLEDFRREGEITAPLLAHQGNEESGQKQRSR
jgi:predicted HTH domain antitoxin